MAALGTVGADESVNEKAAIEISEKLPLDGNWDHFPVCVISTRHPDGRMRQYDAMEQRMCAFAAAMDSAAIHAIA